MASRFDLPRVFLNYIVNWGRTVFLSSHLAERPNSSNLAWNHSECTAQSSLSAWPGLWKAWFTIQLLSLSISMTSLLFNVINTQHPQIFHQLLLTQIYSSKLPNPNPLFLILNVFISTFPNSAFPKVSFQETRSHQDINFYSTVVEMK